MASGRREINTNISLRDTWSDYDGGLATNVSFLAAVGDTLPSQGLSDLNMGENRGAGKYNFWVLLDPGTGGSVEVTSPFTDSGVTPGYGRQVQSNVHASITIEATGDYGFVFDGWYSAETGGTLISASSPFSVTPSTNAVTSGWTIWAQWVDTCLVDGTLITLNNGVKVPIETLTHGHSLRTIKIQSLNLATKVTELNVQYGSSRIVGLKRLMVNDTIRLNDNFEATPTHNHLIKRNDQWYYEKMGNIILGDKMLDENNKEIEITDIYRSNLSKYITKITLDTVHTFFANGIVTHNIK